MKVLTNHCLNIKCQLKLFTVKQFIPISILHIQYEEISLDLRDSGDFHSESFIE